MFSNFTVALLAALGVTAWVFSKTQRRTGGNTRNSLVVAGIIGLGVFGIVFTLMISIF